MLPGYTITPFQDAKDTKKTGIFKCCGFLAKGKRTLKSAGKGFIAVFRE